MKCNRRAHSVPLIATQSLGGRALAIGVVLALVLLVILARTQPERMERVNAAINDITGPVVTVLQSPVKAVQGVRNWGASVFGTYQENRTLKAELQTMQKWQAEALTLKRENETLRELLHVVPSSSTRFISASFINASDAFFSSNALINAGSDEGVKQRQAVIGSNGLLGAVMEAGQGTSRILLLTDVNARVAVIGETSGERAIAAGDGNRLTLQYVSQNHKFQSGERLLTSGDGGFFPAGIPVARLENIEDLKATPFANPRETTMVSVVDFKF